jgi:hypothetical protein
MKYHIAQVVRVVDMNNELIREVVFDHGVFETLFLPIGSTVLCHPLGLKGFDVVYDRRTDETQRYKVVDIVMNLVTGDTAVHAYLEPITLILGQHDVGDFVG